MSIVFMALNSLGNQSNFPTKAVDASLGEWICLYQLGLMLLFQDHNEYIKAIA